jgi:hypothetical protein
VDPIYVIALTPGGTGLYKLTVVYRKCSEFYPNLLVRRIVTNQDNTFEGFQD